jgi:glycosyltransferase involved in cell wall biosynthesis
VDISLIVCTYNRCDSLKTMLEGVALSVMPKSVEWEVLVVDNNSTDRTREVVEEFCRREGSHFRYYFEPLQGKCIALNSGIRVARGTILAFSDDDVTVEPDWLQNLTSNLNSGEWAGAAGRVLRTWNCEPPPWLSLQPKYEKMAWALVSFDLNQNAGELPGTSPPVGANMAFRREVFSKYGGFRTDLGPKGNETGDSAERKAGLAEIAQPQAPRRYDDTEFGRRLVWGGERLRYEPDSVVYHPVPEDRLTKKFFLSWWFGRGRDTYLIMPNRGPIWGIPRYYFRVAKMLALLTGNTLAWLTAIKPIRRFYYKVMTWESAGAILGAIAFRRNQIHDNYSPGGQVEV